MKFSNRSIEIKFFDVENFFKNSIFIYKKKKKVFRIFKNN